MKTKDGAGKKEGQEDTRGCKPMGAKELDGLRGRGRVVCRGNMTEGIILVYRLSSDFLGDGLQCCVGRTSFPVFPTAKCRRTLYAPGCEPGPVAYGPCEGGFMGFKHSAEERICPRCHGNWIRRSHKRGKIEKIVCTLLGINPFRCEDCGHRYYRFRSAHSAHARPA